MGHSIIQNITARDAVISTITATRANKRPNGCMMSTDWTRAKWLAYGERAVGTIGPGRVTIVYKPCKNSRSDTQNMLMFYGQSGVLVHEEIYSAEFAGLIGAAE